MLKKAYEKDHYLDLCCIVSGNDIEHPQIDWYGHLCRTSKKEDK